MDVTQANRSLDLLNTDFRKKVDLFLKEAGDKIFITEAYRSQERQNYLYKQGRVSPYLDKAKVTWTINSMHTKGLAIDIAFKGGDLYPKSMYKWGEIGEIANKYGIDWGYDLWGTDKPHFQDNGKPLEIIGEYRKLAGESVINNPDNLIKAIRTGTPDEAVAAIEIIVDRKL